MNLYHKIKYMRQQGLEKNKNLEETYEENEI